MLICSINSTIESHCTYFLMKCNESKIFRNKEGIIFNMFNFSLKRVSGYFIDRTSVMAAVTSNNDKKIKNHPLHDDNYEGGTSNGSIYTHRPLEGQSALALMDMNKKYHYAVYNNAQGENAININKQMNVNQHLEYLKIEREIVKALQFSTDDRIFYQDKGKIEIKDSSYKDLTREEAINMGFKDYKIKEFEKTREFFYFESQSEEDAFNNKKNHVLNDEFNHDFKDSCRYRFDFKNIGDPKRFKNLNGKQIIEKISYEKLMRNEYTISDHDIESYFKNTNKDDPTEN